MQETKSISKQALSNPDDLERSIKVTGPTVWTVLSLCILLLIVLFIWGVLGSVTTTVTALGSVVNGKAVCFLPAEEVAMVHVGDSVEFGDQKMEVAEIGKVPMSIKEVRGELGSDYLSDTLLKGDWGYQIVFKGDTSKLEQRVPEDVTITVESVSPISLILKERR